MKEFIYSFKSSFHPNDKAFEELATKFYHNRLKPDLLKIFGEEIPGGHANIR